MDGFHIHFSKFPVCRAAPENAEIVAEIVARLENHISGNGSVAFLHPYC